MTTMVTEAAAEGLSKAERKALKLAKKQMKKEGKESKEERKAAKKAAAAAANGDDDAARAKAERKAQKKAEKKQKKEQSGGDSPAADNKKSKKSKRDGEEPDKPAKKSKAAAPIKVGGLASVGDTALATSSPAILKALYKQHPEVTAMTPAAAAAARAERRTAVEGCDLAPVLTFEQTGLGAALLHSTREFVSPSPIQAQCWPIILSGHDLIGIAATGSGKTLGFGLPMMAHIAANKAAGGAAVGRKGPFAVVLAPTRELALQITAVLEDAGSRCGVRCCCVYGGVPKGPQAAALKAGVEVIVGTPGRLEDLMNDGVARLTNVTYLVLDEADRMLDLGFEPHIRKICATIRADRQTLMFSATWPTAVQQLAANFLSSGGAVKVTVGSQELAASHSVAQTVEVIDPVKRDDRLLQLLAKHHSSRKNRIIIFVLYKKEAPRVEALLKRKGWNAGAIHGDISQAQRTAAVEAFKAGTIPLLIATDVAARGLDIPDVEVVINYSFPLTIEDYVHRIGRTGRAGKTGAAITFFCAGADKPRAGELINVLREANQPVPEELLKFGTTVKKKEHKLYGAHFKDVDLSKKATKVTFDD